MMDAACAPASHEHAEKLVIHADLYVPFLRKLTPAERAGMPAPGPGSLLAVPLLPPMPPASIPLSEAEEERVEWIHAQLRSLAKATADKSAEVAAAGLSFLHPGAWFRRDWF
jgi:hypothetical protein